MTETKQSGGYADGPHPAAAPCTEVKVCPGKGRCLFTSTAVKAGQMILQEEPLVSSSPEAMPDQWSTLMALHAEEPLVFSPKFHLAAFTAHQVATSNPDVAVALADKFVPDRLSYQLGLNAEADTSRVLQALGLQGVITEHEYNSMVNVMRFNAFTLHGDDNSCGVFDRVSMVAHSCCPTADIDVSDDGKTCCVIRALRDLPQGQEITISYLAQLQLSESTDQRRRYLKRWLFTCRCPRCEWPLDLSRGFRCLHTDCPGVCFLPYSSSSEEDEIFGTEECEVACASAPCDACGGILDGEHLEKALHHEAHYAVILQNADYVSLGKVEEWSETAAQVFRQHWIINAFMHSLMQSYEEEQERHLLFQNYEDEQQTLKAEACRQSLKEFQQEAFSPWYWLAKDQALQVST